MAEELFKDFPNNSISNLSIFSDYIYYLLLVVIFKITMAGVFPMDDVVLDGCDNVNGHDNFSDDDCIEVATNFVSYLLDLQLSV